MTAAATFAPLTRSGCASGARHDDTKVEVQADKNNNADIEIRLERRQALQGDIGTGTEFIVISFHVGRCTVCGWVKVSGAASLRLTFEARPNGE
jgi:hypothetical protein